MPAVLAGAESGTITLHQDRGATHGTSAQRRAWFERGFESGDMTHGDTFDDRLFEEVGRR